MISSSELPVPDHRSAEPLDGALSLLIRNGGSITIDGTRYQEFRPAIAAILPLDATALEPVRAEIERGLRHVMRVTLEIDRSVWAWVGAASGNGKSNGHAH